MRQVLLWLLAVLAYLTISLSAPAETLVSVDQISHAVESTFDLDVPISALLLGGDTVLCGSGAGIFIEAGANRPWRKVISSAKSEPENMWPDCYCKEKLDSLFWPEHLWRLPGSDEIIVFDSWCNLLLTLDIHDTIESYD